MWRHAGRTVVQLAPVAVLLYVFITGPPLVRVMAVVSGVLIGLISSLCYLGETAEHRAVKAGYRPGTATAVRAERHAGEHPGRDRRYNERWRSGPPA